MMRDTLTNDEQRRTYDLLVKCLGYRSANAYAEVATAYVRGKAPPNYPMPALLVEFDYWSADETECGRAKLYGLEYYKPGRWREFLNITVVRID